jgi:hypothetical protein
MGKSVRNNYNEKGMTKRNWKVQMLKKKADRLKNLEGCRNREK